MTDLRQVPGFAPPPAARPAGAAPVWSVGALLTAVGDALSARFGALTVRGELSGAMRAGSGHCYFTLKDGAGASGALRCAMFRRAAMLCNVPMQDGLQVEVRGRLAVYEPRGELQMVVESMQRLGAGQLYEEFLRLRTRLAAEGLFDAARKRALPGFVRRVGVVTSTAGAALHDVLATLRRRAPHVRVIIYPSLVQGAEAPAALVAALQLADRRDEVDVLLVCRGGGSLEDLWAFNDERLVRAIAALGRPVVSGVGHETDVTLCDLVADLRAATPTAAAEAVALERAVLLEALAASAQRLRTRMEHRLHLQAQRLDTAAARLARPALAVGAWRERLHRLELRHDAALRTRWQALVRANESAGARFVGAGERRLAALRDELRHQRRALANLDPRRVLERGYALLEDGDGHAIVSTASLARGQAIAAVLHDGRAGLRVEQVEQVERVGHAEDIERFEADPGAVAAPPGEPGAAARG
jgi:exodeoxyribonuclease VII large subunit